MNDLALLSEIRSKLEGITDNLKKTKAKLKKTGEVAKAVAGGLEIIVAVGEELALAGASKA
jgi:hypothetical protein